MKRLLTSTVILISSLAYSQTLLLSNEVCIISFKTNNGKIAMIAKDENDKYIIYRFGTENSIELEYPKSKDTNSWKLFKYSYYHRGGGPENAGMDLSHVAFTNENYEYMIYQAYYAESESFDVHIQVRNLKNGKKYSLKGDYDSKQGNLHDLPERDLFEPDDRF